MEHMEKLWYKSQANSFCEALPIGNGSLGGMVYGGVPDEYITLNHDTLWSGRYNNTDKEVSQTDLDKVREYIFNGSYKEAEELMQNKMLNHWNESYMPLGSIKIHYNGMEEFADYKRKLDLKQAVVSTRFSANGCNITNECFASYVDGIIAIKISCSDDSKLNLTISMNSKLKHITDIKSDGSIIISGIAPSHVEPNYVVCENPVIYDDTAPGMKFVSYLKIIAEDGTVTKCEKGMQVNAATNVIMLFSTRNGYQGFTKPFEDDESKLLKSCSDEINRIIAKGYNALKRDHITDYRALYDRVFLELDDDVKDLPTDTRMKLFRKNRKDNGLFSLYFQYGRYLMISSSRPGTQPSNLQGIWNGNIRPVWSSNWTANINVEMNYWPAGICNLLECQEPLNQMVGELVINGSKTAKKQFHTRGWVTNHNVDLWRQTSPVSGMCKYAYWPMGGVWMVSNLFMQYEYTNDKKFLRDVVYPAAKGAAMFCMDWLVEGKDGHLHTCPSTSPENTFISPKDGTECGVSYSSTMDISLIKDLFINVINACNILAIDQEFAKQIEKALAHLPKFKIGKHGQLQEWIQDFDETDPGHRHFSALYGFHPAAIINEYDTPELVKACKTFIERRLNHGSGHIGWSCAWLVNFYARLKDGEQALHHLDNLLAYSSYNNLFDYHPPLGEGEGEKEIFQIDGNFGGISGIAAMLLQSHLHEIHILPALPKSWKKGKIKGLLAYDGFKIDIEWDNGILSEANIFSLNGKKAKVKYSEEIIVSGKHGEIRAVVTEHGAVEFMTDKGETYKIVCKR